MRPPETGAIVRDEVNDMVGPAALVLSSVWQASGGCESLIINWSIPVKIRLKSAGAAAALALGLMTSLSAMASVQGSVVDIVINSLGADPDQVTSEASFREDLGADEADMQDLITSFEREFEIEIPADAAAQIETVGDAVTYIVNKQQ